MALNFPKDPESLYKDGKFFSPCCVLHRDLEIISRSAINRRKRSSRFPLSHAAHKSNRASGLVFSWLADCVSCFDPSCVLQRTELSKKQRGMQRRGERDIPEKTRRPAASPATIPTCEDPEATASGNEPGSPWWEIETRDDEIEEKGMGFVCRRRVRWNWATGRQIVCRTSAGDVVVRDTKWQWRNNEDQIRDRNAANESALLTVPGCLLLWMFTGRSLEPVTHVRQVIPMTSRCEPLVHTVFDTLWRTLAQSSPSNVTADNQFTVDIGIFVSEEIWAAFNIEVSRSDKGECGAAPECKGRGNRKPPVKTRRPALSSGTIPTCKNLGGGGAAPLGIETSLPGWDANSLTTTSPRHRLTLSLAAEKNILAYSRLPRSLAPCPANSPRDLPINLRVSEIIFCAQIIKHAARAACKLYDATSRNKRVIKVRSYCVPLSEMEGEKSTSLRQASRIYHIVMQREQFKSAVNDVEFNRRCDREDTVLHPSRFLPDRRTAASSMSGKIKPYSRNREPGRDGVAVKLFISHDGVYWIPFSAGSLPIFACEETCRTLPLGFLGVLPFRPFIPTSFHARRR
ncbi:hypothetical protein PR048_027144 [Dryococelus australis]|uniref:Uncharacterized protein n=1 Tax=Dryococelus australis TaxID=614101 RepID=A0ABQ9GEV3_9NEOP|nr:hypothetical protein PR048_027144 [Dryococelus australis]